MPESTASPKDGDHFATRTVAADTTVEAERLLPLQATRYMSMDSFIVDERLYQKRRPEVENDRDRNQVRKQSRELIDTISKRLTEHPENHVAAPITIAQYIDETFQIKQVLVDGHHRHAGYKAAGREVIPAKTIRVKKEVAEDLAYTLNLGTETIGVSTKQRLQQVWEMVLKNHQQGHEWTNGWSGNKLGKHFNGIATTVKRMVARKNELGEEAHSLTWEQARNKREYKELTEEDQARRLYKIADEMTKKVAHERDIHVLATILYDIHNGQVPSDPEQYIQQLAQDIRKGRIISMNEDDVGF